MGNTVTYSDPRFGVEKIVICPNVSDMSAALGTVGQVTFTEDIVITEIFCIVSEAMTAAGNTSKVALYEGTAKLAELTIPTSTGAGLLVRSATILSGNEISNGDTLNFYRSHSTAGTGTVYIGFKYRPRFVATA
jgi:hypothetical protein